MEHRIRVAALLIDGDKILLVKHVHRQSAYEWWAPPGGGLEAGDRCVQDALVRLVTEETNLIVAAEKNPRFVREFHDLENDTLNLELYFAVRIVAGNLSVKNAKKKNEGQKYIADAQWITRDKLRSLDIYPDILKDDFGSNHPDSYLGRQDG